MAQVIDLSGPLYNSMWSYNVLPSLRASLPDFVSETVTTVKDNGFESFRFLFSSLSGTYMETGGHLIEGAPPLSVVPVAGFIRPAVICHLPRKGARELIRRAELEAHCPPLHEGDALLIECGWGSQWRSPRYVLDGPSYHSDCTPWLLSQPISLIGADVPCMQAYWAAPGSPESSAGVLLELFKKDVLLLAPLVNLDTVAVTRAELIALPTNIVGVSGAPCRAVLRVP